MFIATLLIIVNREERVNSMIAATIHVAAL
jgi:hypothetical protein